MAHCQWTLKNYNNSLLAPKLSGVDLGFFRYICEHTKIATSQILVKNSKQNRVFQIKEVDGVGHD
jgi:hypothetical protein